jgi:hypothetical protein
MPHPDLPRRELSVPVPAFGGAPGPAAMFFVDPERAQACIDGLREIALDVTEAVRCLDQAYFPPPAHDAVSLNLAVQGGVMAQRAQAYGLAWRDQIEGFARAMEEQLAAYRAADEANAHRRT